MSGRKIEFCGRVADSEFCDLYARARAVLLPGEEDFRIVPVPGEPRRHVTRFLSEVFRQKVSKFLSNPGSEDTTGPEVDCAEEFAR
jgi:hypothetical protein